MAGRTWSQLSFVIGAALTALVGIGRRRRLRRLRFRRARSPSWCPIRRAGCSTALRARSPKSMRTTLGQSVVIENVGGAGGTIAVGRVARAAPDGYTVAIGSGDQFVINAAIYPIQYDVVKDFAPVSLLMSGPNLIVSKNAIPATNLKELTAWLKTNHANVVGRAQRRRRRAASLRPRIATRDRREMAVRALSRRGPGAAGRGRRTDRRRCARRPQAR